MTYYPGQSGPASDGNSPLPPWRRGRSGADGRQTSLQFWLAMLVLGCMCLAGMTWGASSLLAQKGSEKLLRVEQVLPKLKSIQWERKAGAFLHELAASTQAQLKERTATAPHVPPPKHGSASVTVTEPPHHSAGPAPLTHAVLPVLPPIVETCDEPVVYVTPCTSQRGDSPMMRNWKTLSMYSLLAAAAATLAPPPLLAQDDAKLDKLSKDMQALTKSVQALTNRIGELETKPAEINKADLTRAMRAELKTLDEGVTELTTQIKSVKRSVDGFKDDLQAVKDDQAKHKQQIETLMAEVNKLSQKLIAGTGVPSGPASPAVDKAFMEEMRGYMKKMEENSTAMKNLAEAIAKAGPTDKRLSMSPAVGSTAPTYGRLVLNNLYADDLLFIVNGAKYRVPAQTKFVLENVPVGAVRYEIAADRWGLLETQAINLTPGETFTLRAVNRP